MFRKSLIAPLLAATAMALTVSPAYAGKADRARQAIAAAEAKIHTAETMGASSELPREVADARASLALAKDKLARGDKTDSTEEAIHASALADTAIGVMQRRTNDELASRSQDAAAAQQQAANAQDQAADANARAAAAERSAANSAAEAQAARVAAQTAPAAVETTVTTQQPAAAAPHRASRTVTRKTTTTRAAPPATATTTTTTVKQAVN